VDVYNLRTVEGATKADLDRLKGLAVKQQEQAYRFKGKSNVVAQGWMVNRTEDAKKVLDELVAKVPAARQGQAQREDRTTEEAWREAFAQLRAAATPQVQTATRAINVGGAGGGAGGAFYGGRTRIPGGGEGGESGGEEDQADRAELFDDALGRVTTFVPRTPPVTRAGLLSLPVTVPMRGEVYRFEKRNGGAELTISVGDTETGRGFGGFGLFALTMLILWGLYRWRPDRRIHGFWPLLLFVTAFVLMVAEQTILVSLLAMIVATIWYFRIRYLTRSSDSPA
jgi:hypothetical protein